MENRLSNSMRREVPPQPRPAPDLAWRPDPGGWLTASLVSVSWVPRMVFVSQGVLADP